MIERIQLLRNIGKFDSVNAGAIQFTKLTLGYAENSRGKTTLAAILRSLSTGVASWILERRRLGAAQAPHIVIRDTAAAAPFVFQNGAWSATLPAIAVFDDRFVAENVCSGIEIAAEHRQNLHELILGGQGVTLSNQLQSHVRAIEEHNREIKIRADAIPAAARGSLSHDEFCALEPDPAIASKIGAAERALAAARAAQEIADAQNFDAAAFTLPGFDVEKLQAFLAKGLPGLETEAEQRFLPIRERRVQAHIALLGNGAENWLADGVQRGEKAGRACPYCAQDLAGSPLIAHYRAYFSESYAKLKSTLGFARR